MKVVLFCGGLGTRLRDYSETIPKPLVNIGHRPIIWHLMKFYAYYGHKDFILCLGHRGDLIKEYFLKYNECVSNDFFMANGGREIQLYNSDIHDWRISFVDTGLHSNLGQRLKAVEEFLTGDEVFMANYSDGLSDLPIPRQLELFQQKSAVASFMSVRPSQSFHAVSVDQEGFVSNIQNVGKSDVWINGGFFIFRNEIFKYIDEGDELIEKPFQRLISQSQLVSYKYNGFWAAMDTFKDKMMFDDMYARGDTPWQVWKNKGQDRCLRSLSVISNAA